MIEPGQSNLRLRRATRGCRSAEAAVADGRAASRAASAAAATASTATTATAAAATTTATAPCDLRCAGCDALLLVEQVERRKRDVGDLFFTEQDALGRREIQFLRCVRSRQGRCRSAPRERKCQSGSAQRRDCGFGHSLPFRSLLHWHSRILQPVRTLFPIPAPTILRASHLTRKAVPLTNALRCIQFPFILMNVIVPPSSRHHPVTPPARTQECCSAIAAEKTG
jgi:hypothetical protein